ncbi:hypothetical protein ACFQE1_19495 [Halobium palmae]|uniref:Energy transducer TonB n=1 Tax=Halobium palmae TaxID=1776492 RepID=A0ABD5S5H3_9EURY
MDDVDEGDEWRRAGERRERSPPASAASAVQNQHLLAASVPRTTMVSKKALALTVVGLFVAASLTHYALFGSLPFGKPAMLEADDFDAVEPDGAEA